MPSRRFWVSDIRAALIISAMMRGKTDLSTMCPLKKRCMKKFIIGYLSFKKNVLN